MVGHRVLVRDVDQVRDLLQRADSDDALTHVYRTVDAAVDATCHHRSR